MLLAFTLWLVPFMAGAVDLKIATIAPENSSWMKAMREGAADIETRTDGRVKVKLYGGGVMGNDRKVLRKIRIGQLHGASFTASGLGDVYNDIHIYGLPLLFNSQEEVDYVRARMDELFVQGLDEAGMVSFGFTGAGFARIMSNEPIRSYDDLAGKKVWVPEGDVTTIAAMEALGLSPVVLPLTDVLTALQTGLVDIVGASEVAALVLQWHTKLKYVTDYPLIYIYATLVIDKRYFDRLEPADQAVVREVLEGIYEEYDRQNLEDNVKATEVLKANGITYVEPAPGAIDAWRERVAEVNRREAANGLFSEELFEQMLGLIDEYRRSAETAAVVSPAE
jgi:TRAP-type C4-dicarboxylate transport system substrate-binding protein